MLSEAWPEWVTAVLSRVSNTWVDAPPPGGPRISETTTSLMDVIPNLITKKTFNYNQYNNRTDVYEYGFGTGAPGPLLRRTHTDYLTTNQYQGDANYAADANIHIRNLPREINVFDGSGTLVFKTSLDYDRYELYTLQDCPGIVQHDGGFHTGYGARGNVTKTIRWLFPSTEIATYSQHDIAGNVVKVFDGRTPAGITTFDFIDCFGSPGDDAQSNAGAPELAEGVSYAFPTKVTNALGHTAYTKYDYYLGKPVTMEDANQVVSSIEYNDDLDRPTQSIQARYKVGFGIPDEKRQTTITYDDVNRVVTTTSDRDADNILTAKAYYDGLGRTWRGASYEGSTWTIADTEFDALGRVSQVSNPYRASDPGSASPPANLWTTTEYDALGRVLRVTTPDGAHIDTTYSGNRVTVTDQAGKKRSSETDALGRLVKVIEAPAVLNYETTYLYDVLGNLRKVTQGSQTRWFAYDSLSRLIRAKNPEQADNSSLSYADPVTGHNGWSMAYSYDPNGNLESKTDARNITTNYEYDALNRNTKVNYLNTAINPDIMRQYDGATNGKGRPWADYAGGINSTDQKGEHNVIGSYDALGRPLNKHHLFKVNGVWSAPYSVSHTYDLAGNVKRLTYPSGHFVDYSHDQAGRLSSFSGNLGGLQKTYADNIGYNAAGQIIKERFGTNTSLYHNQHYNNRMQLVDIRVGDTTDEWDKSRGAMSFLYGTTAVANGNVLANDTDNNGNLRRQVAWVPLAADVYVAPQVDDYTYDALNRISSFTDSQIDSGGQWTQAASQNFSYDPYGNRKVTSASGGVSNYNPTYDTVNNTNRIMGLGYDAAGNITSDLLNGGPITYDYDEENRLRTASSGGAYTYDADGKRTRRTAGGPETWYIYGIGGELLAEYEANGTQNSPQKEYGYRAGQLLIVADGGSGGGVSLSKPPSQSKSDLIGKAGSGAGRHANRISSSNKPFGAFGHNKGYGSITAESRDSDSAKTPATGGPRVTAEEYGNASSANGAGVASRARHPGGAETPSPQKQHGARKGLTIVTPQSNGVVTVNPTANQSPDPGQGGSAVNSPSNTGHGHTTQFLYEPQNHKTCVWHSFQSVSGQVLSITLKFQWGGLVFASVRADEGESGDAYAEFVVEYSLNGGSTWNYAAGINAYASASDGSSNEQVNFNPDSYPSGALTPASISIPSNTPISQIRVRSRLLTSASGNAETGSTSVGNSSPANTKVENIRLEVERDVTPPVISNVAAGSSTPSSATITWNTNENSDSQVEYWTTPSNVQSTPLNSTLVTAHSQALSGLTAGQVYHYRVKSKDAAGNLATSDDFSFGNAAAFVSQSVPATMTAGEAYEVTVRMLNQGNTTWTPGQAYRLGSQNPQDNATWGLGRVGLLPGDSVSPGATATFSFVVTAPSSPGSYNFQWQMVQDGVEWFGAKTPNIAVQVVPRNDSATFISQTVPSVMGTGATYSVSITFRNTGNTTWTAANQYRLGSQNPENNGTWGLGRVELGAGELVRPGDLKTFSFQVVAPSSPGPYNFQWRMVREGVNWFGAASTNLVVVTFSPTDTTQPTVTSFFPASGATNVNPNANVTVIFSEAMNEATVNTSTIELRDPSNATVSAVLSYNPATFTATLDPSASLAANTTYTVRVRGGSADPRVKDLAGNALAADVTWTFTSGSGGIKWLVTDHLGSTRMVIDETGSLAGIRRHDYAPFGEELVAGAAIRSDSNGYGGDSVSQKFTSKMRDPESGLDYFGARYFSNVQGRFTSVDEAPSTLINPQTLNKYRYALNNPLYHLDPDGNQEKKESTLDWLTRIVYENFIRWKGEEDNPREKTPETIAPGFPHDMSSEEIAWQHAMGVSQGIDALNQMIMIVDPTHASSIVSVIFDVHQGNYDGALLGTILINAPLGRKFQDKIHAATGISKNTETIFDSVFRTASGGRIPDMLDKVGKVLGEVKGNKLTQIEYRGNLQDFIEYARKEGYQLNLYVRQGATIQPSLRQQLKRIGAQVFAYDEKTKVFTQIIL